mmetsp:Transcript_19515/g.45786  ORF Transcript_19515/g.45786 Transcript_19515/m.45786 type:complete len:223 (+) Transcript_19515:128-796(+)
MPLEATESHVKLHRTSGIETRNTGTKVRWLIYAACGLPFASKVKKNPSFLATPFILAMSASRCAASSLSSPDFFAAAALSLKNFTKAVWTGSAPAPPLSASMAASSADFLSALSDTNFSVTVAVASAISDDFSFSVTDASSAAIMPMILSTCALRSWCGLTAPAALSFAYDSSRISLIAWKSLTMFWFALRKTSFCSSASMTLSSAAVCSLRRFTAFSSRVL